MAFTIMAYISTALTIDIYQLYCASFLQILCTTLPILSSFITCLLTDGIHSLGLHCIVVLAADLKPCRRGDRLPRFLRRRAALRSLESRALRAIWVERKFELVDNAD